MMDGGELVIILLIAVVLIGPKNLPRYADQLAQLVRKAKAFVSDTSGTLKKEMGAEDLDLSQFDLRQYDPRRIVRDTLLEDISPVADLVSGSSKSKAARSKPSSSGTSSRKAAATVAASATTVAAVTSTTTSEVAGADAADQDVSDRQGVPGSQDATAESELHEELPFFFDDQAT